MYTIVDSCLLCLTSNKSLKSILSQDSHGVLIEEKLKYFLFEFKNIEPEIAKNICLHCLEYLNHVCNFKQLCLRNVVKFNSYIHILKTVEEPCRNLQNDTKNSKENQVDTENESHIDMIENFNFANVFKKTETIEYDTETEYVLEDDHTEKTEVDEEILRKEYNVAEYVIEEKGETINVNDELKYEIVDVIVKEEPEDICDEIDIKSEMDNDSKDKLQNESTNNTEYFPTSNTILWNTDEGAHKQLFLHKHIDNTVDKLYKCEECDKEFKSHRSLVRHKDIHTGVRAHKCDVCEKAFRRSSHLAVHKLTHTGVKSYKCDVCDKAFTQSTHLTMHKFVHTGVKGYKCDVCAKKFKTHRSLVRHKAIHTGVRAHKCDVCDKAFTQPYDLKIHKVIHTGVKGYKCDVCGKAFTKSNHLTMHKLIHTGVKAYKCEVCDKAFTHPSNLRVHKRLHTDVKPYACDVCGKAFNQKHSLTSHKCIHSGQM